jgi:hypothetical protein
MQDESSHFWTLSLSAVGPAGTLLLGQLGGFFQQKGVRDGDCILISPQPDGSMLLQLGQGQNARQAPSPTSVLHSCCLPASPPIWQYSQESKRIAKGNLPFQHRF